MNPSSFADRNEMEASSAKELLILFRQTLTLAWLKADPGETMTVEALEYRSVVDSDFTAFYNRIVDSSPSFVGIQIVCLVEGFDISSKVADLPFVEVKNDNNTISVFLCDSTLSPTSVLDDQAFGGRIYESITGALAISLDVSWLSLSEKGTIEEASAHWLTLD